MTIFLLILGFFLAIFLITAVSNLFTFPRLKSPSISISPSVSVSISILIPARNEAAVIGRTVRSLLDQSATQFELLLLDDGSTDGTTEAAQQAAAGDPRLKIITGQPLPAGWLGKNWACHQLSQQAQGELLLFADADVQWRPGALAALLAHRQTTSADLLTIWPTQHTETWAEWLVVPLMKFAIVSYLPLLGVHFVPWAGFAAANGQCLLFTKKSYVQIGGHTAVRHAIIEDVELARAIKKNGRRLRMADGGHLITCRMYDSWAAVRAGFAKNILAGHANSVPFLLLSTGWHWAAFVLPWLLWPFVPAAGWLVAAGLLLRFLADWHTDRRPLQAIGRALLHPISVLLMTAIAAQALLWQFGAGPTWKGRVLKS